ncbi:MAG: cyanophycin synthetase, partial [Candidatus Saccharimonadales bacterium]
ISKLKPVAGRMNILRGQEGSTIIDDSYNASPLAVSAALDTLYTVEAPQRIAILGSMNELGNISPQAHELIGLQCDPSKIEWVITIGEDAAKYLAPAAVKKGCQVKTCHTPYEAGGFAHSVLKRGAVVLVKGSQNGVYSEEAVKVLLHNTEDNEQLVRQSSYWLKKKDDQFDRPVSED